MHWLVLVISGMFEAVWAVALSKIEGLSTPGPIALFILGMVVSMGGLGWALREIPVGTGYAAWVGVGAATTALYAFTTGAEPVSVIKILLILGIVACVAGLKLVSQ
ncbi:DMT family transporter [Gleimia hominis]|uniref:DMT family transporter n=1 Tax=Gleimia hominis TaxID=595468 RepID=UPI000C80C04D|nr:SMR family transporter [Gleimia hominis]WIK64635.1 SMR family transporter [Gleimia hominis]